MLVVTVPASSLASQCLWCLGLYHLDRVGNPADFFHCHGCRLCIAKKDEAVHKDVCRFEEACPVCLEVRRTRVRAPWVWPWSFIWGTLRCPRPWGPRHGQPPHPAPHCMAPLTITWPPLLRPMCLHPVHRGARCYAGVSIQYNGGHHAALLPQAASEVRAGSTSSTVPDVSCELPTVSISHVLIGSSSVIPIFRKNVNFSPFFVQK
jgi:hypothetical protein